MAKLKSFDDLVVNKTTPELPAKVYEFQTIRSILALQKCPDGQAELTALTLPIYSPLLLSKSIDFQKTLQKYQVI